MKPFFLILLVISIIIQSTITTIPLVFLTLLNIAVLKRESFVYPLAFTAGIVLDLMLPQTVGISSVYFVIFIFLVLSYQRKFEIQTPIFVFFSSLVGSFGHLTIFSNFDNILLQSVLSAAIGLLIFNIFDKFNTKK